MSDMHTYRFSDALSFSLDQLAAMHSTSFTGYFMPVQTTAVGYATFCRMYQIDLAHSVIMHDDATGAFVGAARVGVRGDRAWCGGFGIAPEYRGMGAGKLLAQRMITVAREHGLATLQLEVLSQNAAASHLYAAVGFQQARMLYGMECDVERLPDGADAITIEPVDLNTVLPYIVQGDRPAWQREIPSLLSAGSDGVLARDRDGVVAAACFARGDTTALVHGALREGATARQIVPLLRHAAGSAPRLLLFNEPETSSVLFLSRELGFHETYSQYEMHLDLAL